METANERCFSSLSRQQIVSKFYNDLPNVVVFADLNQGDLYEPHLLAFNSYIDERI